MSIRVLLADDQQLLLTALSTIINSAEDIEVIATCTDGIRACELAREHSIDLAVLDIRMPHRDGIDAASIIMREKPAVRVIMLTTFNDNNLVQRALQIGVHGFLLKDSEPETIIAAIRAVQRGESVLSSGVTGHVIDTYRAALAEHTREQKLSPHVVQGLGLLTQRELEVLLEIGRGRTNTEIAETLFIGTATVKTHVSSLLAKLHCRDRVALAVVAHQAGLMH